MTRKELIAEHRECDRVEGPRTRVLYKALHVQRRGCPLCRKLREEDRRAGRPTICGGRGRRER